MSLSDFQNVLLHMEEKNRTTKMVKKADAEAVAVLATIAKGKLCLKDSPSGQ